MITLTMATTIAVSLLPSPGAQAAAGRRLTLGEAGSGPPPIPVVLPRTDRDATARARGSASVWSDLDRSTRWAKPAIDYVGATNEWMRDFAPNPDGTYPFQPSTIETRKYFARAVVMALAPAETVDPSITFADLDPSDAFYPAANIAVKLHWMKKTAAGTFAPDKPVTTTMVHRVLTFALGLGPAIKSLNHLHTADGVTFKLPANFGALVLGMRLGLRYNSSDESADVGPTTPLSRAQVAYSLYRAVTQPSWNVPALIAQYQDIELPSLTSDQQQIVQWGVQYVGYPYVWGGEWGITPSSYGQPVPGFDCSGFTWWLLRASDGGYWSVSPPRPYLGWDLPQRTSADMATIGKLSYEQLQPGDLMFYDGDGDGRVDHVDTFIGEGWALDSSSTPGGVTIMWVGDGWYRDHFVHGRRLLPIQTI
ncbi:MAG: NlpC/P60 family protein [Actinomycetota bacterium]